MSRALIIGGGPAGTTAAMALHQAGHDVEVYEACPRGGEARGAFLVLGHHGMHALARIEATGAIINAGFPVSRLEVHHRNGDLRGTRELDGYHQLRRADLYRVLQAEASRRGIPIHHGHRLEAFAEDTSGVTAFFANGRSASGNFLIGADGLWSHVRRHVHAAAAPEYAGQRVVYGTMPGNPTHALPGVLYAVPGERMTFGYVVSFTSETFWFVRLTAPAFDHDDIGVTNLDGQRGRLAAAVEAEAPTCSPIVNAHRGEVFIDNTYHMPDWTRWYTGRALLLGDAAHAVSPAGGQGASFAVEDGIAVADAIEKHSTVVEAFKEYEAARRTRVTAPAVRDRRG
jgi:2-polyprenyl-6-methoxyphenol hydroxylase-like FAD-dependent oxidoreductase